MMNPKPNTQPLGRRDRAAERILASLATRADLVMTPRNLARLAYDLADALAAERHDRWIRLNPPAQTTPQPPTPPNPQ